MDADQIFAEILKDNRIIREKIDDVAGQLRSLITKDDFNRYDDKIGKRLDEQDAVLKEQNQILADNTKTLSNNSKFIDGFRNLRYVFVAALISGLIGLGVSSIHPNANASTTSANITKISTVSPIIRH